MEDLGRFVTSEGDASFDPQTQNSRMPDSGRNHMIVEFTDFFFGANYKFDF